MKNVSIDKFVLAMYKPIHFSLLELINTSTTTLANNVPTWDSLLNLISLCKYILDPLRDAFGKPIHVNSGYRSNFVNEAVGGVSNSQHKFGYAADISVSNRDSISELFALIQEMKLPFDQVIYYRKAGFIHISWSPTYRKQVIVRDA